jgi:hypothetical protein
LIRPRARRNDYGFTVGGPVEIPKLYSGKDKTFFFFNFEQFRETQIINNTPITVPTNAYRNGDFSGVLVADGVNGVPKNIGTDAFNNPLFAGEIFDPLTRRTATAPNGQSYVYRKSLPEQHYSSKSVGSSGAESPVPNSSRHERKLNLQPAARLWRRAAQDDTSAETDYLIGSKQKISFYWSETKTFAPLSPIFGNSEGLPSPTTESRGSFIGGPVERLNYDYTLSPTMLLHIGVGYQQNNFFDDAPVLNYNAAASLGLTIGLLLHSA